MNYSDKLNGFWEEGYHVYAEIRDDKITLRNYMRKIDLETTISYDADLLESGKKTPITLACTTYSTNLYGEVMSMMDNVYYENGELHMTWSFTYNDDHTDYTLKKVDHGPFDHIEILDDEYIPQIQGEWYRWTPNGAGEALVIDGNTITWHGSGKFHVIRYKNRSYDTDLHIVPFDLTDNNFPGFNCVELHPDHIRAHRMVCDFSTPISVFARKDMLNKIEIPESAKGGGHSVMTPMVGGQPFPFNHGPIAMATAPDIFKTIQPAKDNLQESQKQQETAQQGKKFCPECGYPIDGTPKFCSNCGAKL
jgi:hypothetical protein